MPSRDTSADAWDAQVAALRRLGAAGRLRMALEMSVMVRKLAQARIRQRNPQYTDAEARSALLRELYPELAPPEASG
jgi:hypothetical protein